MAILKYNRKYKIPQRKNEDVHDRLKIKNLTCRCFSPTHNNSNINTNYLLTNYHLLSVVLGGLTTILNSLNNHKIYTSWGPLTEEETEVRSHYRVGPSSLWDWNPGLILRYTLFSIQCSTFRQSRHGYLHY